MSEWWTYSLRDLLLFSPRTYYRLFELYNLELWPLQIFFLAAGAVILLLWRRGGDNSARIIAALLVLCWLWVAWAYHWQRYATINWAAHYYAPVFALEALLMLWLGVIRGGLTVTASGRLLQRSGLVLFVFSLAAYPLLGLLLGRNIAQAEIFGMAPDPTALATLGMLLFCGRRHLWWLAPIPVAWCLISGATLWAMNSPDYIIPPLAALLTIGLTVKESIKSRRG